jgi:hypothetical protein
VQQIIIQLVVLHVYRTPSLLDDGEQTSWPPFSEEKNNFVTITSKPSLHSNFRFCQMALWSGIFPRLQSATCEAMWGITKFSEDALAITGHAIQQGVSAGAAVSAAVNSTLSKTVGTGAINIVLDTLPVRHGIQAGDGQLIHMVLNTTVPPQNDTKAGNGTVIKAILNEKEMETSGNIVPSGAVGPNATAAHGADKMGSEINTTVNKQDNFVLPATASNTDTSTAINQNPPGLFPLISKPLMNRTTLLPSLSLFPRPVIG